MPSLPGKACLTTSGPKEHNQGRCVSHFVPGQYRPEEGDLHWRYKTRLKKTTHLRINNRLFRIILDSSDVKCV